MSEPVAIATWLFGRTAVDVAWERLGKGDPVLDAALAGAQAVEDDPMVDSVGFGGIANAIGTVSLDACVMDGHTLNCGAVAGLENIRHAAAVARRVMEKTPHILLVGEGARWFAIQQGFPLETLNTPESVVEWEKRRPRGASAVPGSAAWGKLVHADRDNHDPVTALALAAKAPLGGGATTPGLAHN